MVIIDGLGDDPIDAFIKALKEVQNNALINGDN